MCGIMVSKAPWLNCYTIHGLTHGIPGAACPQERLQAKRPAVRLDQVVQGASLDPSLELGDHYRHKTRVNLPRT